jgi:hypothetical protein
MIDDLVVDGFGRVDSNRLREDVSKTLAEKFQEEPARAQEKKAVRVEGEYASTEECSRAIAVAVHAAVTR